MFVSNIFKFGLLASCSLMAVITTASEVESCMVSTCRFNATHDDYKKITKIALPAQKEWCISDQLDDIDNTIFGKKSVAYSFSDIDKATDKKLYVMYNEYAPLLQKAQSYASERTTAIENEIESITKYEETPADFKLLLSAQTRLLSYQKELEKSETLEHMCPGLIIPQKTLLCVLQLSSQQQ